MRRLLLLLTAFLCQIHTASAEEITGPAQAIDGDTIAIAGQQLQLAGILAPPLDQICTKKGQQWRCGEASAFALAAIIERHWLTCRTHTGPTTATCRMGGKKGIDIGRAMVRDGWAKTQPGSGYEDLEQGAKQARRGLWAAQ